MQKPIVIGIGGSSCSGKSTAAANLHRIFRCHGDIVCQDVYATNPLEIITVQSSSSNISWLNWESLRTINIDSFVAAVKSAEQNAIRLGDKVIIVEGFLIFADPRMENLFDIKVFIDIDKTMCYERRLARGTDTIDQYCPDPSNWNGTTSADEASPTTHQWLSEYFEGVIWPHYLLYRNIDASNGQYLLLEAGMSQTDIADSIMSYISTRFSGNLVNLS